MIGKHSILAERGSILYTGDSKRKKGTEDDDMPPRGPYDGNGSYNGGPFIMGGPFVEDGALSQRMAPS